MWIDVSVPVNDRLPVWPSSPGFTVSRIRSIKEGDKVNVSQITCDVHTGTHVDAPKHFIDNGGGVETLDLDDLIGRAWVVEIDERIRITAKLLENAQIPEETERLLVKTSNSKLWEKSPGIFDPDFAALTVDGAQWMTYRGIRLVGIDYLSIQLYGGDPETHRILLREGIVIVEGLDLGQVTPGAYEMICLPLKLEGADGAPARVVLHTMENSNFHLRKSV